MQTRAALIFLHATGAAPIVLYGPQGVPWPTLQTGVLVAIQVLCIILAFVPTWISLNGKTSPSIGYQWLKLLWSGEPWALSIAPYASAKTKLPFVSARSRRITDLRARLKDWSNEDQRNDYYAALRQELLETSLPPEEEMYILDTLITDALILADPTLRLELDQWSLRALQLGADIATLVGSRGAALVELGRFEEGKVLLETIMQADNPAPFDLLMSKLFLARAEHALGHSVRAAGLMTGVRAATDVIENYRPEVIALIERIEREIQGSL